MLRIENKTYGICRVTGKLINKERLKLVLIHDRTDLAPGEMAELKDELIEVISRYIEIDPNSVQINMTQEGREQRLIADIPIKPVRRRAVS